MVWPQLSDSLAADASPVNSRVVFARLIQKFRYRAVGAAEAVGIVLLLLGVHVGPADANAVEIALLAGVPPDSGLDGAVADRFDWLIVYVGSHGQVSFRLLLTDAKPRAPGPRDAKGEVTSINLGGSTVGGNR